MCDAQVAYRIMRVCVACGKTIDHRHRLAISCSTACYQWARKRPGQPRPSRICLACGRSLAGRHPNARVCDRNCGHWAKRHPGVMKPRNRTCVGCGANIDHFLLTAITCGNACMRWHQNHPGGELRQPVSTCEGCGASLDRTKRADARHCDRKCIEKAGSKREAETFRDRAKRRRALIKGASPVGRVRALDILDRDGWRCQIQACLLPINPLLKWPDPMSKSIDHIVPVARGGAHTMENLRAAHLGCNSRKGAKIDALEGPV